MSISMLGMGYESPHRHMETDKHMALEILLEHTWLDITVHFLW